MQYMVCNEGRSTFLKFLILHGSFSLLGDLKMRESAYQGKLIKKLQRLLPGCYILRNDPTDTQGVPDILILFGSRWAMLEVKLKGTSPVQPNQQYYVDMFDDMSFASFIYPENEEQVLHDLQSALRSGW